MSQVPDSARLSLEDFCAGANCQVRLASSTGKFHDFVAAISAVAWVNRTLQKTELSQTSLIRSVYSERGLRTNHNGSMSQYLRGRRHPSAAVATSFDQVVPGTSAFLRHPIWSALRLRDPVVPSWVEVCRLFEDPLRQWMSTYLQTPKPPARILRSLRRRNGLDGLAALLYLFRADFELGREEQAASWIEPICASILVLNHELLSLGIAVPLAEYIERYVLSQIDEVWDQRISFLDIPWSNRVRLYEDALMCLEDEGRANGYSVEDRRSALEGKFGEDIPLAVMPWRIPKTSTLNPDLALEPQIGTLALSRAKLWSILHRDAGLPPRDRPDSGEFYLAMGSWEFLKELSQNDLHRLVGRPDIVAA